jgi:hypothetical protein
MPGFLLPEKHARTHSKYVWSAVPAAVVFVMPRIAPEAALLLRVCLDVVILK